MKTLRRLIVLGACAYVGGVALLWSQQEALIFPGWAGPSPEQVASVPGLQDVSVPHPDGTTRRGWMRVPDPGHLTLVIFHGNAGFQWDKLRSFAARGYGLLLVAYGGYAGNPGAPGEAAIIEDARATLAFVADRNLSPRDVLLYGESLGSGVAARMALEPGAWRGLVLDAPYTSVVDRAAEIYWYVPVRWLIRHRFDTAAIIGNVAVPILILHGGQDEVIPIDHGKALFDRIEGEKAAAWLDEGTHALPPEWVADAVDAQFGQK